MTFLLHGLARSRPRPPAVGTFNYAMSDQSLAVRAAANQTIHAVVANQGLGLFMPLTETQGVYCAHPLGGCRMADSPDLGVVDDTGEVYGYEGLYCIDGSIVPTSLGVNPSLTISALSERCAERLVDRGADFGLPAKPPGFRPGVPPEHIGPRAVPSGR
jgi:choline dehydrogenase-like flavoprotein